MLDNEFELFNPQNLHPSNQRSLKLILRSIASISMVLLCSSALADLPITPELSFSTSDNSIIIDWTQVPGATGYEIFYSPYPSAEPVGRIDVGAKSSLAANFLDGGTFYVSVRAYNEYGSGVFSNIEQLTLNIENNDQFGDKNSSLEPIMRVEFYTLQRGYSENTASLNSDRTSNNITTYSTENIVDSNAHTQGGGDTENTLAAIEISEAPVLTVSRRRTNIEISWSSVSNASGYTLFYSPFPEATPVGNLDMGSALSISGELEPGSAFYVSVQAYNDQGSSDFSNIENFTIPEVEIFLLSSRGYGPDDLAVASDGSLLLFIESTSEEEDIVAYYDSSGGRTIFTIGENGLPHRAALKDIGVVFSNYTSTTVDLALRDNDGSIAVVRMGLSPDTMALLEEFDQSTTTELLQRATYLEISHSEEESEATVSEQLLKASRALKMFGAFTDDASASATIWEATDAPEVIEAASLVVILQANTKLIPKTALENLIKSGAKWLIRKVEVGTDEWRTEGLVDAFFIAKDWFNCRLFYKELVPPINVDELADGLLSCFSLFRDSLVFFLEALGEGGRFVDALIKDSSIQEAVDFRLAGFTIHETKPINDEINEILYYIPPQADIRIQNSRGDEATTFYVNEAITFEAFVTAGREEDIISYSWSGPFGIFSGSKGHTNYYASSSENVDITLSISDGHNLSETTVTLTILSIPDLNGYWAWESNPNNILLITQPQSGTWLSAKWISINGAACYPEDYLLGRSSFRGEITNVAGSSFTYSNWACSLEETVSTQTFTISAEGNDFVLGINGHTYRRSNYNTAPTARIDVRNSSNIYSITYYVGEVFTLDGSLSFDDQDPDVASYSWSVGSATGTVFSINEQFSRSYSSSGIKTIFLTVKDSLGLGDDTSVELTILEAGDPEAGGILETGVVSEDGQFVNFELDIFVVDENGEPVRGLNASDFTIGDFTNSNGLTYSFDQTCFSPAETSYKGPYSAVMLLDQSGSIANTDPLNTRIDAARIFFNALGPNDNALLAAFAGEGRKLAYPMNYWGTFDRSTYDSQLTALEDLIGGNTPLYDAVVYFVLHAQQNGPNSNKAVIVFTDGEDRYSTRSLAEAISIANNLGVQVFTVGLGDGVDNGVLQQLALDTGGSMMFADEADKLVALYGVLGNVLSGGLSHYHTCWSASRSPTDIGESGWFATSVRVTSTGNPSIYIPFRVNF